MLFAFDYNDNRIHIDDTQSNKEYFCPYCGVPLITKKGDVRQHHFAHKPNHLCSDTWEQTRSYDISPWHNEWQECFPKNNQEVKLSLGETTHRADVLIGRTVVEFQHSIMPVKAFDDRNNFYINLNYKVVWLFDLSDLFENGDLTYCSVHNELHFSWRNPKKAFNSYDVKNGCIDLFFQISNNDDAACIVRVTDVSEFGFESFKTSSLMRKNEFLAYVGLVDSICPAPDRTDLESNESYLRFKKKYHVDLNKQQERTVQSVEGAVLLLAVPGSGKTTVLVDRLGYMVNEREIDPSCILAITFNKRAAEEMRTRYSGVFGSESGDKIDFRTINSLSLEIYTRYCELHNKEKRNLIYGTEQRALFKKIYQEFHPDEYPSEGNIIEFETAVAYAKNMMLSKEQISELDFDYPEFSVMFQKYCDTLYKQNRMDFDDQMVFAYWILTNDSSQTAFWQKRYHYICVDEAQDTSKIQHEIIRIIARGNSIFMVGDEDQSIYGFRAAYPKALLNFRADYNNPYILRMERNYRSTPQIVEKAQNFINENKGRYEKTMVANRDDGKTVELIEVKSVEAQYSKVLSIAKKAKKETAFLYRDNESAVVLVDSFLRNNISFYLKKPEMNFFRNSVVQDIVAYLTLVIDPYNTDSLKQICNKGIIYLKKQQLYYAVRNCSSKKQTVLEAVESQMQYLPYRQRDRADHLKSTIDAIAGKSSGQAIRFLLAHGYEDYLEEKNLDYAKVETLLILAKQEPKISKFLNRLKELEGLIQNGFEAKGHITLSTIHSSKGLEYDTVYMVDVYDGRFPSAKKNIFNRSKDNADEEQEERRLFYVGITRAKNELYLFNIDEKPSSYIDSLFPEFNAQKIIAEQEIEEQREDAERIQLDNLRHNIESQQEARRAYEQCINLLEEERKKEAERQKIEEEQIELEAYNEVKELFTQQDTQIRDSRGVRWVKCEICGQILPSDKFVSYGGLNHINLGTCRACSRKYL